MTGQVPPPPRVRLAPTSRFTRRARKLTADEQRSLARALRLFQANPRDPRIDTHKLAGPLAEKWAFSCGYDLRVIFQWDGDIAVLLDAGSHDEVYG